MVFVEVDLDAPLPSSVYVDIEGFCGIDITVDYPWIPKFCSTCKGFDHGKQFCPNSKEVWKPVQSKSQSTIPSNVAQPAVEKASVDATPIGSAHSDATHVPEVPVERAPHVPEVPVVRDPHVQVSTPPAQVSTTDTSNGCVNHIVPQSSNDISKC